MAGAECMGHPTSTSSTTRREDALPPSKSALKKLAKARRKAEAAARRPPAAAAAQLALDPQRFGPLPLVQSQGQSSTVWTAVADVVPALDGQAVVVRARIAVRRAAGKIGFLVLRGGMSTVQCVLTKEGGCPTDMVKYACSLPVESIVDVWGTVVRSAVPVQACTQATVEIAVAKLFCVSASEATAPFCVRDAAGRGDGEITVGQYQRIETRWLDMRTPANQAIWRLRSKFCQYWRRYLCNDDYFEIHTPKIVPAAAKNGGGFDRSFKVRYFDKPAFLARSPEMYKQIALMGDMTKVFECGPAFRVENAETHLHLCEFTRLDVGMEVKVHYAEVRRVAEELFAYVFDMLQADETCRRLLDTVSAQWPSTPFIHKLTPDTLSRLDVGVEAEGKASGDAYGGCIQNRDVRMLRLTHSNAVRLLNASAAAEMEKVEAVEGRLNEQALAKLVKDRYGVDFFTLDCLPLVAQPFCTMPHPQDPQSAAAYRMFMRGREVSSGAQRVHDPELLRRRCEALYVDAAAVQDSVRCLSLGAWPHGGFSAGLERVMMQFLGLGNIRVCSLFPRTPNHCVP
eukprot:TRINITY_DN29755_c0_g1_i1.p1 TRINITY_DN29755_c0_g1~~TRINITY_DN29755_c0_g1_i1.p1  ORF type:complete len:569 (+),score=107.38 TRINITY_DN29755_c0_g1_i1:36-1742(+)